jgi:hypothetical protein
MNLYWEEEEEEEENKQITTHLPQCLLRFINFFWKMPDRLLARSSIRFAIEKEIKSSVKCSL